MAPWLDGGERDRCRGVELREIMDRIRGASVLSRGVNSSHSGTSRWKSSQVAGSVARLTIRGESTGAWAAADMTEGTLIGEMAPPSGKPPESTDTVKRPIFTAMLECKLLEVSLLCWNASYWRSLSLK